MQNNISVIATIYNEEKRIEKFLKALSWCDDIIIINKGSTDSTADYCKGSTINLLNFPYTDNDGDLSKEAIKQAKHDWIACVVASDVIDYSLIKKVNQLISQEEFSYNTINVPFRNFILGMDIKGSPWHGKPLKRYFFRKSSLNFSNIVHHEVQFDENSVYELKDGGYVYHLSHQSVESQNERHIRYTKREAQNLVDQKVPLKKLRFELIKQCIKLLIKNKFWANNDLFAFNIAFLTYYAQRYLFVWENYHGSIEAYYDEIKDRVIKDLEEEK